MEHSISIDGLDTCKLMNSLLEFASKNNLKIDIYYDNRVINVLLYNNLTKIHLNIKYEGNNVIITPIHISNDVNLESIFNERNEMTTRAL
ncbi:hypothetical protein DJ530_04680 [Sulfolobus sp. E1]|nr:hypothetical protein DJ530_04680 [Sulfolobus sp. E1]